MQKFHKNLVPKDLYFEINLKLAFIHSNLKIRKSNTLFIQLFDRILK